MLPSASVSNVQVPLQSVRVNVSSILSPVSRLAVGVPPLDSSCTKCEPSHNKLVVVPLMVFPRRGLSPSYAT